MRELKSIEEKILDRALFLIGKNHSCRISIRDIAKTANVNISAVNYYFRSKEEMLNQAKELYIINTESILDIFKDDSVDNRERLIRVANEIMEYNIRYPGITVLLKESADKEDNVSKRIIEVSKELSDKVNNLLDIVVGSKNDNHYYRIVFWASINYPLDNYVLNYDKSKLEQKEARLEYLEYLLKRLG